MVEDEEDKEEWPFFAGNGGPDSSKTWLGMLLSAWHRQRVTVVVHFDRIVVGIPFGIDGLHDASVGGGAGSTCCDFRDDARPQ